MWICLYIDFFFSINAWSALCILGFRIWKFNQPLIKNSFLIHSWESADAEGQLNALFYAIHRRDASIYGFGIHGILEPISCRYWGTIVVKMWGVKSYMQISTEWRSAPLTPRYSRVNSTFIPQPSTHWFQKQSFLGQMAILMLIEFPISCPEKPTCTNIVEHGSVLWVI